MFDRQPMTSDANSASSGDSGTAVGASRKGADRNGWVKMGVVAAASVMLGGLAAAWFYRKALSQLREAENEIPDSESSITEDETAEDF
jgi:hypothetical protein